jgi:hypothetical protein
MVVTRVDPVLLHHLREQLGHLLFQIPGLARVGQEIEEMPFVITYRASVLDDLVVALE